jgi:hypothetical protein
MSNPKYKPQQDLLAIPSSGISLPLDRPVSAYYRQSTLAQVGNVSTAIQTIDMPEYLKRLGWPEDKIILIDMDEGVSGSKKIDERQGMSVLFELISEGKIGAVACQDEDRLFRDVTQIQVNIFIEACRAAHVLVLTPSMVYDFANELTGVFHARQFRFKCEMAAEYINAVIRGKLHKAKRRLQMEGRWAGGSVPTGFMVDMRRTLPDGSKNDNWRRLVPFEPYAEIVNQYFQLFLEYAGNVRTTVRHIHEHGPYYPDPQTCKPPDGFRALYRLHRYGKGYCPGRTGLLVLLTNAAYIGHWAVNDVIVRWNNHPAIVPVDVFTRAFNYRSEFTLDGRPNPHYHPVQEHARPSCEEDRTVERPLCSGMLISKSDGEWRNVGTDWVKPEKHYAYVLRCKNPTKEYVWSKTAAYIDEAVAKLLLRKLLVTFNSTAWDEALSEFSNSYDVARRRKLAQLAELERVMENQIASLDTLTNHEMIKAVQGRYEDTKREHARLTSELEATDDEARQMEVMYALKQSCSPALENWPNQTRDEKRVVLGAFIKQIEATPVDGHGLHLVVCWRDGSSDEVTLPRQATRGNDWLPGETARLFELLGGGASQIEIAREFPDRKWRDIMNKVWRTRGKCPKIRPKLVRDRETYEDYCRRAGCNSLTDMDSVSVSGTARRDGPAKFRPGAEACRRRPGPRG